jgi:hypothetical protein
MDSLLSFDSDASSNNNSNFRTQTKNRVGLKMPPKGKFSSTTSLLTNVQKQILLKNEETWLERNIRHNSPPPILPRKSSDTGCKKAEAAKDPVHDNKKEHKNSHKNNASKRRVSISTDAVQIIGESSFDEIYNGPGPDIGVNDNNVNNITTCSPSNKQMSINNKKEAIELKETTTYLENMSVPDLIPSHELANVAFIRNQSKEIMKPVGTKDNYQIEQNKSKNRSIYASNKDLEDLTEKGLPSVRDLVNKFLPNRTASVNLRHSPEPKPRQSLLQKVLRLELHFAWQNNMKIRFY